MKESWNGHTGQLRDCAGEYRVIACEQCGFSHVIPLPAAEALHEVYSEDYYVSEKPLFIERQLEDLDWWHLVYNDRYDFFESQLPEGSRRILDIGCGPGLFLQRGAERGWSGLGVEPSRQAAEYARSIGVDVVNATLEEAALEEWAGFDVVHMSEVLEHIPDPVAFSRRAAGLLRPGGILCVVVPNDYNPLQRFLRTECGFNPYWVAPPHHLNYFSSETIGKLLERAGLKVLDRVSTFPMEVFLATGNNYVGDDVVGRRCHGGRKDLERALDAAGLQRLRREMYQLMARHNVGREVIVYAGKD